MRKCRDVVFIVACHRCRVVARVNAISQSRRSSTKRLLVYHSPSCQLILSSAPRFVFSYNLRWWYRSSAFVGAFIVLLLLCDQTKRYGLYSSWFGGVTAVCRTYDWEVEGSTPNRVTHYQAVTRAYFDGWLSVERETIYGIYNDQHQSQL